MNKRFDRIAVLPFEMKAYEDDGEMYVEGKLTTDAVDRTGEVMEPSGIKNWAEFKRNPVLLWNHNSDEPIGHAVELRREKDHIWSKDKLARTPLVVNKVWPLLQNGTIRSKSIGFGEAGKDGGGKEKEGVWHWTAWNLFEQSLVAIPANPNASAQMAKSLGIDQFDMPLGAEEEPEDELAKQQSEEEMCAERIVRICGAIQGVSDIAIHWQRAGNEAALATLDLAKLQEARERLDILLGTEPNIELDFGDIESRLRNLFPVARNRNLPELMSLVLDKFTGGD